MSDFFKNYSTFHYNIDKVKPIRGKLATNILSRVNLVDKVLKDMLIDDKTLKTSAYKTLLERTGSTKATWLALKESVPTYKTIEEGFEALKFLNQPSNQYVKKMPFSKQLTEALEISKGIPTYIDFGEGKKGIKKPKETVMDFASLYPSIIKVKNISIKTFSIIRTVLTTISALLSNIWVMITSSFIHTITLSQFKLLFFYFRNYVVRHITTSRNNFP